jgi:preprotein translocase subunit SecF
MTDVITPPTSDGDVPGVTRRHRFADLYHERTNFRFIERSRRWAVLSVTLVLISVVAFFVRDLNLSIDFEGGTVWLVEVAEGREATVPEVRDVLAPLGFGDAKVSTLDAQGDVSIRVQAEVVNDPLRAIQRALAATAELDLTTVTFERTGDAGTFTMTVEEGTEITAETVEAAIEPLAPDATVTVDDRVVTVTVDPLPESPVNSVADALAAYAGAEPDAVSISTVGPTWGETLSRKALQALVIFFLLLAAYLSVRFEWKMALAAILSVVHDVVVTAGFYALFQFQVTPATVTAFLTILGFSLYDTVVVFDKIVDNTRALTATGRATYPEMVNRSLNAVLMRSLSTTIVAVLPVLSLLVVGSLIMGATALQDFALALAAGLVVGSYSSLFVAAPLVSWWKRREPQYQALEDRRRRTTLAAASAATGVPVTAAAESARAERSGLPGPPAAGRTVTPRPRRQKGRKRR